VGHTAVVDWAHANGCPAEDSEEKSYEGWEWDSEEEIDE
jgi:hypothetical protein